MTNDSPELQTILDRLSRVERQNRRFKWAATLFLGGFSALFLMGQASTSNPPEAIEAQKFVVRDAAGNAVAALGLGPKGSPLLVMTRKDGKLGVTLEIAPDEKPALTLYDKDNKPREVLSLERDGSPALSLADSHGVARVGLAVSSERSGGLILYGDNKTPRASFGLSTNWAPFLVLMDASGNVRTAIGSTAAFPSAIIKGKRQVDFSMAMLNTKGATVWKAP